MPLLIAGTNSGCGKSTVTLGVISALARLGNKVQAFKAGPDFIDPGIHGLVTGRPSRNLDLWMCGADYARDCLHRHSAGADAVIIEGAMGLYDGGERSTAALAEATGASIALVVNAYGMAESAGAVIGGFNGYGRKIDGVIFNNVGSERHYERLKAASGVVEPLGYIPRDAAFAMAERHLGLVTAWESPISGDSLRRLADAALSNINMERVAELSASPAPPAPRAGDKNLPAPDIKIAIARDRAFCFYYEDNLDMLREAGAELVPFSPLCDAALPDGVEAVYIGGGYPELYAGALAGNSAMTAAVREQAERGMPVYAECGGLMYLGEGISIEGAFYPMAGVFPFRSEMKGKSASLGYREIRAGEDCLLGKKGQTLRGHEFHYSEVAGLSEKKGVRVNVFSEGGDRVVSAMYKSALASYVHVHFGSRPGSARHFVSHIKEARWKR